jgi:hypothetical protein
MPTPSTPAPLDLERLGEAILVSAVPAILPFGPRAERAVSTQDPKQSLAAADRSAFSAMGQHKPELNRNRGFDQCLQLCFINNST